jgi:hypothetical protein
MPAANEAQFDLAVFGHDKIKKLVLAVRADVTVYQVT